MKWESLNTQGITHLYYEVEDNETLFNDLRAKGVDIAFGPRGPGILERRKAQNG